MRQRTSRIGARARLAGYVVIALCVPLVARAQLSVSNFEVFLHTTTIPVSGSFLVRNVSDKPQTSQLHWGDWMREENGNNIYRDSTGVLPGSCGAELTAFPMTLRLAPGEAQAVRVTYSGAPRTTSCWEIVYVGTAPQPSRNANGAQLNVKVQQGIKVYVEPASATPQLLIDTVGLAPHLHSPTEPATAANIDSSRNDVLATVTNPGTIQVKPSGRVEYRTLSDSLVARDSIPQFPVLPGARRTVRVPMATLPAGHYVILIIFDYGGPDLRAAQLQVDVNP